MASNFTSYGTFKTAVASWLDVSASDLSSQIDDLIQVAEVRLFREVRTRDMEQSFSTSLGGGTVAVWTDYVEMKVSYLNTSPTTFLQRQVAEYIYAQYPRSNGSGIPKYFARDGSNFIFGPYPDSSYTWTGTYFKKLTAISSSLNTLFTNNPDLYLWAVLAESEALLGRDTRIAIWEAKYASARDQVNGEYQREQVSGSTMQMRVA